VLTRYQTSGMRGGRYNPPILLEETQASVLLFVSILKGLSEILALSLVGQGILWLIAGRARESNFVYTLFAAVTRPVMRLARIITPRFVLDRHIWMVAVLIVFLVWMFAGAHKLRLCLTESSDSPLCGQMVQTLEQRNRTR
jgi:hypothetical protein